MGNTSNDGTEITINVPAELIRDDALLDSHPIAAALDRLLHGARDIQTAAGVYVPLAVTRLDKRVARLESDAHKNNALLESNNRIEQMRAIQGAGDILRVLDRLSKSRVPQVLEASLFLGLFSVFDAFTGDLLKAIYQKQPSLFQGINRQVSLGELLQYESVEALKLEILDKEIESLRRESYVEQFSILEKRFSIELRKFERWPNFIEAAQRRNLLTHADGCVSEQYLTQCIGAGYTFDTKPKPGEKLSLGAKYFFGASELVMEVGLMLGQTLWRKVFPNETQLADDYLNKAIYDCLLLENWPRAIRFCEYGLQPVLIKQVPELGIRIRLVNLAIALKFSNRSDDAVRLLDQWDWSASLREFKLAEAVLKEEFKRAAKIMLEIGKQGELLKEHSYYEWPLFREFRQSDEFLTAYQEIFDYPYVQGLQRNVDNSAARAKKNADKAASELGGGVEGNIDGIISESDSSSAIEIDSLLEAHGSDPSSNAIIGSTKPKNRRKNGATPARKKGVLKGKIS